METPLALIVFNRPDTTAKVLDAIRQAQPKKLYVIADGPRPDVPEDVERCRQVRALVDSVDWECTVHRNYADTNLGCGIRPASGISWVFESESEAIILEDDCLPDPTFFRFCSELLDRYRDDTRIMHINGNNLGVDQTSIHPYSYAFTQFAQVWGWATWRRAWQKFDHKVLNLQDFLELGYTDSIDVTQQQRKALVNKWRLVQKGRDDIWDYQWHFAVMSNSGLAVSPTTNLVSNIGFGTEATHTKNDWLQVSDLETKSMHFPLTHPGFVRRNKQIDTIYAEKMLYVALGHRVKYGLISRLQRNRSS